VSALPVLGRQVRAFHKLTGAAATVADLAADAARAAQPALDRATRDPAARARAARVVADAAERAIRRIETIDLGPGTHLVGALASARRELVDELNAAVLALREVRAAASGVETFLRGPSRYLLFAANNAEMRAGSGAFLQVGTLTVVDGRLELSRMESTGAIEQPDGVPYVDADLGERWGWLSPNVEWRNLGLSARFPVTAAQAAAMWRGIGREVVDGVVAVDPVALEALLRATGPVEAEGERVRASTVVDELLVGQYERFLEPGFDQSKRRDRLRDVTEAVVAAVERPGIDLPELLDGVASAARGRHVLVWSRHEQQQAAWEAAGVDGAVGPSSFLLSVINRGGGRGGSKLDAWLDVQARVREKRPTAGGTAYTVVVTLRNQYPVGRPSYIDRAERVADAGDGTYFGLLAMHLPRSTRDGYVDGTKLSVAGRDGPTQVMATTELAIPAGRRRRLTVHFVLPDGQQLTVEPTGRIPRPILEGFRATPGVTTGSPEKTTQRD
jgi:hypothetical protein